MRGLGLSGPFRNTNCLSVMCPRELRSSSMWAMVVWLDRYRDE